MINVEKGHCKGKCTRNCKNNLNLNRIGIKLTEKCGTANVRKIDAIKNAKLECLMANEIGEHVKNDKSLEIDGLKLINRD